MSKPTPTRTNTNSRDSTGTEDFISATLKSELTQYSCNGYLDPSDPTMITAADRKALVDWCYGIVDHYQLSRETVAVAMEMVDRFLSISAGPFALWHVNSDVAELGNNALHCQSEFQLLTAVALCSSLKEMGDIVSSDQFVESYCSAYTKEKIETMEYILQKGLSWRSNVPPSRIGTSLLSLLVSYSLDLPEATWAFLLDEMKYQTELAVQDYYFSTHRPSTIALAATFNAIESIGSKAHEEMLNSFLTRILECFGYGQSMHMSTARSRLQRLLRGDDVVEVGASTTKKSTSPGIAHDSTKTSTFECESIFGSDYLNPDLLESVDDFMSSFSMDCEDNPVAFPVSTATTTTASPGNNLKKPARPMPAYHMFLQLEREFIIQTIDGEDADKSIHDDKVYLDYVPERYRQIKLSPDWYFPKDKRKRRKHRKQHGKIGHKELTLTISSRWAELGQTNPEVKRFVQDLAERELMEYRREMEEYEKHLASNMARASPPSPSTETESKNTSKRAREEDGKPPQKQPRLIPSVSTPKTVQEKECPLEETIKLCLSTISTDLKTFDYRPVTKAAASNRVPHDRERISRRITLEDSEDLAGFNFE
jgi:hypothetical protein